MKKILSIALVCAMSAGLSTAAFGAEAPAEAPAEEAQQQVIEISTAEELAAINDNLSGSYVLTGDIDLAGAEWTPIGSFVPMGEREEQELPDAEYAFTGTFDGNGYTISNLTIDQPEGMVMGLFGCIANADVGNFTVSGASCDAGMMGSDVVGYAYCSQVHDISLEEGKVTAHLLEGMEEASEGMFGGIVAAGMSSVITNCKAQAEIVLPDGLANAGIIGGGLESTSVIGCEATGSVTAGNNCYGLGVISGCGFGAEEFTDNTAYDASVTAGNDCYWIGGITGYAGGFDYEVEFMGEMVPMVPVTVFTNCNTRNVTITTGENAEGVDDIVGAGFYSEEAAEMMGEPFDQPTIFELVDCKAE